MPPSPSPTPTDHVRTPWPLTALLMLTVFWVVQQMHLPADLGLKGLNSINLLILGCVLMVLAQRFPSSGPTPIRGAFILFFLMLAWAFVAGQLRDSSQMMDDLTALKNGLIFVSLYFIFFHAVRDERTIHLLFLTILGVSLLVALEAIREGLDYGFGVYSETRRAAGPFGPDYRASNLLAAYLVMFTPLFVGVALYAKHHPWVRAAALGGIVLMVMAAFVTYSRQAYAIMAAVILLMTLRRNLVLGVLILVALVSYESWVPEGVVDRISMTEQVGATGEARLDESTESRFELWRAGAEMLGNHPGGIGLNHFKREIGQYDARLKGKDAHNFTVLMMAEGGYFGLIATLTLYLALGWLAWTFLRVADTPEAKAVAISFAVSTLALVLANLYGSRLLDGPVTGCYWVFAALAARYRILIETGHRRTTVATQPTGPAAASRAARRAAGAAWLAPRPRDQNGRLLPLQDATGQHR